MSTWNLEWENTQIKLSTKGSPPSKSYIYKLTQEPHCELCGSTKIRGKECWNYTRHSKLELCNGVFQLGGYYAVKKLAQQEKEDSLTQFILRLKDDEDFAEPVGGSMALAIKHKYQTLLDSEILIPIPAYGNRYNQARSICNSIVDYLNTHENTKMKVLEPLRKIKDIELHKLKTSKEREDAVQGMFDSNESIKEITGKKITIVDDMLTTGTTMSECIKILSNYRPAKLWVYVATGNV